MRKFETGAIRDDDHHKLQFTRCLSPLVLKRYCEFMQRNNVIKGKKVRKEDDWKKGFTFASYIESKGRHFLETWLIHEGYLFDVDELETLDKLIDSLCAELFNTMGDIHMLLLEQRKRLAESAKPVNRLEQLGELSKLAADMSPKDFEIAIRKLGKKQTKKKQKKRKLKKKKDPIHYFPTTRKSAICGLKPKKGFTLSDVKWAWTRIRKEATCKTCKKVMACWIDYNNYRGELL